MRIPLRGMRLMFAEHLEKCSLMFVFALMFAWSRRICRTRKTKQDTDCNSSIRVHGH